MSLEIFFSKRGQSLFRELFGIFGAIPKIVQFSEKRHSKDFCSEYRLRHHVYWKRKMIIK